MKTLTHRVTTICLLGAVLLGCGGGGGGGGDGNENQPPTNDRTWGMAAPIVTDDGNNSGPQIAMDVNGNAIAVWTQDDGTRHNIWANRYVVGVGWETAGPIESNDGDNSSPQIAMDANGNAIAMWTQQDGTQQDAWTNRYTAGVGWGTEAAIKTGDGSNYGYNMAMSANSDAIVVWGKSVGTQHSIWASRYVAGVGWETAEPIRSYNSDLSYPPYPQVTMDANGNAIAVWTQLVIIPGLSNLGTDLVANRYTAGVGWGTATPIAGTGSGSESVNLVMARIAMNAGGDAIISWGNCNDNRSSCSLLVQNYVTEGFQWMSSSYVPNLYGLDIAMDAGGNAIVVWTQCIDADCNQHSLWASRYLADTIPPFGETNQPIGTEAKGQFPDIAMDADGNAIVVWTQGDSTPSNILATRYVAGTGWETAAIIETDDGNNSDPQIAMTAGGDAIAVWTQWDGTRFNIWANEFK